MTSGRDGRAVVVGGGLGGLTAALALHRGGWDVTVLERAPSLEPVGAGISLWPNGLRALDAVGVGAAARRHARLAGPSSIRRPDGRVLARSDVGAAVERRFGEPLVLLHRADLVALLAGGIPASALMTGTTVTGVDAGDDHRPAQVSTASGELEADVVVAADGIRSALRGALLPGHPAPRYAGYTAWRFVVAAPAGVETGFETWGGRGLRFAVLPLSGGRLYCYATQSCPPGGRAADEAAELRRLFGRWHDPIPRVLADLPASTVLRSDVEHLDPPLADYARGRVAFIGDAAHAMTPDLGQGGGMALEDAVVLGALLSRAGLPAGAAGTGDAEASARSPVLPGVPATLRAYSAARRERTADVALRSRRAGGLYGAPLAVQTLAARAMGLLPPGSSWSLWRAPWTGARRPRRRRLRRLRRRDVRPQRRRARLPARDLRPRPLGRHRLAGRARGRRCPGEPHDGQR